MTLIKSTIIVNVSWLVPEPQGGLGQSPRARGWGGAVGGKWRGGKARRVGGAPQGLGWAPMRLEPWAMNHQPLIGDQFINYWINC